MNNIKDQFTIKDLENLSGIKAHTIRIWEKRYALLSPNRTDTNIRYYDVNSLQKLLNVSLLNNNGHKISKIAELAEEKIPFAVRELISKKGLNDHSINSFKIAMLNFDQKLFNTTYNQLLLQKSFREIFLDTFLTLLNDIGLLWQTNAITPAHEHFISNLIKQKIHLQIEKFQVEPAVKLDKVFVLFLPMNEIHELGLLYIHLELLFNGYNSIYLGQSVPIDNIPVLKHLHTDIVFVSYFTVYPDLDDIEEYVLQIDQQLLRDGHDEFWCLGRKLNETTLQNCSNRVKKLDNLASLLNSI